LSNKKKPCDAHILIEKKGLLQISAYIDWKKKKASLIFSVFQLIQPIINCLAVFFFSMRVLIPILYRLYISHSKSQLSLMPSQERKKVAHASAINEPNK
jgi:hypothetical protein